MALPFDRLRVNERYCRIDEIQHKPTGYQSRISTPFSYDSVILASLQSRHSLRLPLQSLAGGNSSSRPSPNFHLYIICTLFEGLGSMVTDSHML